MPTNILGPGASVQETKVAPPPPKKTQATLSSLLNVLDSLVSKEGHSIVITINAPKFLDPALYRGGAFVIQQGHRCPYIHAHLTNPGGTARQ